MCSDLLTDKAKCALEDGLKDSCEIFCEICRKISIMEVAVFRIATFLNKVLYEMFIFKRSLNYLT